MVLLRALVISWGATAFVYALVAWAPGSSAACGDLGPAQSFFGWWQSALTGDFGRPCFGASGSVIELVVPAALRTGGLVLGALALALTVALTLVQSRAHPGRLTLAALLGLPTFVLAYWWATVVNVALAPCQLDDSCPAWFPLQAHDSWVAFASAVAVMALSGGTVAELARGISSEVRRTLQQDWVVYLRSTGAPLPRILWRALRGPVLALLMGRVVLLVATVVVVEIILGVRGLGSLTWEAARFRDVSVLLTTTLAWAGLLAGARGAATWRVPPA